MSKETKETPEIVQEITLETVNDRLDQLVNVVNNLIMYCNTVEKWRNMSFKPANTDDKVPEVISDADDKKK